MEQTITTSVNGPCASLFYCLSARISTLEAGIADIGGE